MSRVSVFVTHSPKALAQYYGPRALAALQAVAHVQCRDDDAVWTAATLARAARDCDIIVSDRSVEGSAELLGQLPQLLAFCRCAVDIRNIDVGAASAQGILVTQASAGFLTSVAEWTIGVMIDLSRHISRSTLQYRAGQAAVVTMGRELRGATLGIVGYGQIGRTLADMAHALGMHVVVHDPHFSAPASASHPVPQLRTFDDLLADADHVVCLAPATLATENLFGATAFAAMRPDAFFINASRGNLVDEAALLCALDDGRIGGCALDVGRAADQMPSPALARHPLVIATPHIGGLTLPAIEHQSMETVQQVTDLAAGRLPQGAVNATYAMRWQDWLKGIPELTMPDGACDCHVHIDDDRDALAPSATFKPPHAPVSAYVQMQQALGLKRAVLVQPTGYGVDNTCLLDALAQMGDAACGIAVVPPDLSDAELSRLHAAGVRGVCFMLLGAAGAVRWEHLAPMAARIAPIGWTVNLQFDGREMPERKRLIDSLPGRVVIDHIGRFVEPVAVNDPAFLALQSVLDRANRWVKLSGPYETSKSGPPGNDDVSALARALSSSHPGHCLWASNWPHPNRQQVPEDAELLALLHAWAPDMRVRESVLVDNATATYSF